MMTHGTWQKKLFVGIIPKMMLRKHGIFKINLRMFHTIAKDSCFHFHYLGTKEDRDYDNNPINERGNNRKTF